MAKEAFDGLQIYVEVPLLLWRGWVFVSGWKGAMSLEPSRKVLGAHKSNGVFK